MAAGGQIYRRVQTIFGWTQLDSLENISDKFRKKSDQWSQDNEKNDYGRTDGWTAYSTLNIAAESDPGCYGIAGFKACKTSLHIVSLWQKSN